MFKCRTIIGVLTAGLALTACGSSSDSASGQMVISTYGTGTSTYADTAAVASAMAKESGTKTRIITSDTGVGRMTPLKQGTAQFARAGAEYAYAFEGAEEFATPKWGPQPIRVAWAPTIAASFATLEKSGIEKPADLRGKKVPRFLANPSATAKMDGLLAAGGLTRHDVKTVEVDYSAQTEALKAGKADVIYMSVGGADMFELDGQSPVHWIDLDPNDAGQEAAFEEKAPDVWIEEFTDGAGQEKGEKTYGLAFVVPVVGTSKTPDESVRTLVRGITDSFEKYQDATTTTPLWAIDKARLAPDLVPFHPALVKFLKDKDLWTPQAQRAQDALLAREKELQAGWREVTASAGDDLAGAWAEWKAQNLDD